MAAPAKAQSAQSTFSRSPQLRSLLNDYTRPGYAALVVRDRGILSSAWKRTPKNRKPAI